MIVNVVSNAGDKCTKGKAACGGSLQCYNLTDPLLPKLSEPGSRTGTCVTVVSTTGGACIANQAVCGDTLQCYSNDTTSILSKDGTCKIVRQLKDKCTLDNHDVCQNDEKTKLECYGSLLKKNGSGFCTAVSILGQSCDKWSKCKNEGNPDDSECYENGKQTTCEGTCVNLSKNAGDQCSNIVKCAANDELTGFPMTCKIINGNIGNCYFVKTLGQNCDAKWSMCDIASECYAGTCANQTNYVGNPCSSILKCADNDDSPLIGDPMYCEINENSNGVGICKTVSAQLGQFCFNGKCNVKQKLSCYAWSGHWWLDWLPKDGNIGRCFGKEQVT